MHLKTQVLCFGWLGLMCLGLTGCAESEVTQNLDTQVEDSMTTDATSADGATEDTAPIEDTAEPDVTDAGSQCSPGDGCFGEPCGAADDCISGICTTHMGDKVCSKTCDAECPKGWSCTLVDSGGDGQYVCMSNFSHLCLPCDDSGDCLGDVPNACVKYPNGLSFCGGACDLENPCPEGYGCQEVDVAGGEKSYQCIADSMMCECSSLAVASNLTTPCEITNDLGTCEGIRVCTEEGLKECDAVVPSEEQCNGIDDNCDGDVDEGTCDDGNPCTEDGCDPADGCVHTPITGGECLDGSACTQADHCEDGACVGEEVICNDNEECTEDSCDPELGCQYAPTFADCDDGDACTVGDTCKEGKCASGVLFECNDDNPCTDDSCGEAGCLFESNEVECDDNDPCTTESACKDGACSAVTPLDCNDDNFCTDDGCDPATGCTNVENASKCDDGDPCTTGDECTAGGCLPGVAVDCDDNNPCTDDSCDPATGCVYTNNNATCSDGSDDTKDDTCNGAGTCVGTPYDCPEPPQCTASFVKDGQGCVPTYAAGGVACDDNDLTTKDDVCDGTGGCAGSSYECPEATACTPSYTQDGTTCIPTHAAPGALCDDEDNATNSDSCDGAGGCAGLPYDCPATSDCTPNYAKDGSGCIAVYAGEGVLCDDKDDTTKTDVCDGAGGCAGTPYTCPEATACTTEYTQNGSECIAVFANNGTGCDDGLDNTKNDVCDGSGSCAGEAYNCPATDECNTAYTQNGADCVPTFAPDGTTCENDKYCSAGTCTAYVKPVVTFSNDLSGSHSATAGDNKTFSVAAQDTANPNETVTYQWYLSTNGGGSYSPINGADSSSLTRYNPFYYSDNGHVIKCRATVTNIAGTTTLDSTPCSLNVKQKFECDGNNNSGQVKISSGGHKPSGENGDQSWGSWSPGGGVCEVNGSTNNFSAGGRCDLGCKTNGVYQGYDMQLQLRITRSTNGTKKHWGDSFGSSNSCGKSSNFQINANGGDWNPIEDGTPTFHLMIIDNGTGCKNGAGNTIFAEANDVYLNYTYKTGSYKFNQRP